ncbi:MAG: ribonuclease H-like domain-containing protein [Deltaproteobacteria bacterium]|nr:ribonuclease H-like domain-containing protein [Deltaproteobacteria bacterium]
MTSGKNIVVFDLETKNAFDDVGGKHALDKLGISVLGAFDYVNGKYTIYEEAELGVFFDRLQSRPLLVGFNNRKFDTPVLQSYSKFDLKALPQLDLLEEMVKTLGHRVSLDSVASATLGKGKTGDGLDAIRYYRSGEFDKLKKYCLEDVKITRQVYEFGAEKKELFYTPKFGSGKARAKVDWKISHPDEAKAPDPQQSLF